MKDYEDLKNILFLALLVGLTVSVFGQDQVTIPLLNNVVYIDGVRYTCSDVGITAAVNSLPSSGGTVDARGCAKVNPVTIGSTVNIGGVGKIVTFLTSAQTVFSVTISNCTSPGFVVYPSSSWEGDSNNISATVVKMASSLACVTDIVQTYQPASGLTSGVLISGVAVDNSNAGTVKNAMFDFAGLYDSSFYNLGVTSPYYSSVTGSSGIGIWVHDLSAIIGANSLDFYHTTVNGDYVAGARPVLVEQNFVGTTTDVSNISFFGGDLGHPGSGNHLVEVNGHGRVGDLRQIHFDKLYYEDSNNSASTLYFADVFGATVEKGELNRGSGGYALEFNQTVSGSLAFDVDRFGDNNYLGLRNDITSTTIYGKPLSYHYANPTSSVDLQIFDGSPVQFLGGIVIPPRIVSALAACASGTEGTQRAVSDSTTNTWGATITGGGSDHVLAYCDGTQWTVIGK